MQPAEQPARPATLYVVATPLGNLRDITLHALDVLKSVDRVAAEDTRVTQALLAAYGIRTRLTALHEHNERTAGERLLNELRAGRSVALVCDAGTPAISDPGAWLVRAARAAGLPVVPVPGPSAVATALSAAGLETAHWLFYGFLPARTQARRQTIGTLRDLPCALVFYEAPHRIRECLADLAAVLGGRRRVTVARELTKRFEEVRELPLGEAADWIAADPDRSRGEFVLLVEAPPAVQNTDAAEARRVLDTLLTELPPAQAARLAARLTGHGRDELYAWAVHPEGLIG